MFKTAQSSRTVLGVEAVTFPSAPSFPPPQSELEFEDRYEGRSSSFHSLYSLHVVHLETWSPKFTLCILGCAQLFFMRFSEKISLFCSRFTIEGSGECAFIFKHGISSANCGVEKKYICSKKGVCPQIKSFPIEDIK